MGELSCHKGDKPRLEAWFGVNETAVAVAAAAGSLTLTIYNVSGYAAGDTVIIKPGTDRMETKMIATDGVNSTTGVLTFTSALRFAHGLEEVVTEARSPTAIILLIDDPSGNRETKAIGDMTTDSLGYYYYELTIDQEGDWTWNIVGTGAVVAGSEDEVIHAGESRF